jgi:hypothetical protein
MTTQPFQVKAVGQDTFAAFLLKHRRRRQLSTITAGPAARPTNRGPETACMKKRVGVLGSGSAYKKGHNMSRPYISLPWMMLEEIARGWAG